MTPAVIPATQASNATLSCGTHVFIGDRVTLAEAYSSLHDFPTFGIVEKIDKLRTPPGNSRDPFVGGETTRVGVSWFGHGGLWVRHYSPWQLEAVFREGQPEVIELPDGPTDARTFAELREIGSIQAGRSDFAREMRHPLSAEDERVNAEREAMEQYVADWLTPRYRRWFDERMPPPSVAVRESQTLTHFEVDEDDEESRQIIRDGMVTATTDFSTWRRSEASTLRARIRQATDGDTQVKAREALIDHAIKSLLFDDPGLVARFATAAADGEEFNLKPAIDVAVRDTLRGQVDLGTFEDALTRVLHELS